MTARGGGYAVNLRRMGFAEDEIARLSDRLVDSVVAWAIWTRSPRGSQSTCAPGPTRSR